MGRNIKPRKIVMWLRETENHSNNEFFRGEKEISYHKFFKKISERDNFRFAFGFNSYKGGGVFYPVSMYKKGNPIETRERFKTDVIYQFNNLVKNFYSKDVSIVNTPKFKEFCNSKITTYKYLKEFFPETYIAFNKKDLLSLAKKIKTTKIVLKPNRGKEGDNVFVFSKSKIKIDLIPDKILKKGGFIIQEFIDTSRGIDGITKAHHDLRIITIGNKISLCHIRQPQDGSLISNAHLGASITEIDIDKIPEFILDFYKKVHKKIIKKYPMPMYSMDIGVGKNGPRLIELNGSTAFPRKNFKCLDLFIDNLINYLETV